jgi:hypothetical protein
MLRTILRRSTSAVGSSHSTRLSHVNLHSSRGGGFLRNNKKKTLFFGSIASLLAYDYAARDLEFVGGLSRFLRSIKIAAQISYDYSVSLWGVEEDSDEYNKVRIEFGRGHICLNIINSSCCID